MKTPKRYQNKPLPVMPEDSTVDDMVIDVWSQRAKRKNRVKQLKRTIARLTAKSRGELWMGEHLKCFSPEWDAFMILRRLKTPAEDAASDEKFEYWITLRKVGELALNAACLAAKAYGKATEKENAACPSETAENATQGNLICVDEAQLTARKETE